MSRLCKNCGRSLSQSQVSLDASGSGFTLIVTGIPVFSCLTCGSPLVADEIGEACPDAIVLAVVNALESLAVENRSDPLQTSLHCRVCKTRLPHKSTGARANFRANFPLYPGGALIGVEYYGEAIACPRCGVNHPCLSPLLYHQIRDSIMRALAFYLPK